MVFLWPNPGLNVSKLFNELVRVPGMTGKLIILEKPPAHLRTCHALPLSSSTTFSPFLLDDPALMRDCIFDRSGIVHFFLLSTQKRKLVPFIRLRAMKIKFFLY